MIGPKTLLIAVGGRGEVEPFLALARGLTAAGHGAVVAGPRRFATLAAEVGVEFVGLDDSVFTLRRELGRAGIGGRRSPYLTEPDLLSRLDGLTQLVRIGPDAVLFTQGAVGAASLADHLGVPALPAQLVPTAPATSAFAAPSAARSTPHALHRWSWGNSGSAPHLWRSVVARWRIRQLGLSPHEALGVPTVLALPIPMYVPTPEFSWPGVPLPAWWPQRLNRDCTFNGVTPIKEEHDE